MAKSKKDYYDYRKSAEKLDDYTDQLIQWIEKMESNGLDNRQVTTIVTKHGTVLVQVR